MSRWSGVGCGQCNHLSDMPDSQMSSRCEEEGQRTSELIISSRSTTPTRCTARRRRHVFGKTRRLSPATTYRAPPSARSPPRQSPPPPAASSRGRPGCPLRQHAAAIGSGPDGRRKQSHRRSARMWARGVAPKRWTRCRLLRWPEASLRAHASYALQRCPTSRLSSRGFRSMASRRLGDSDE